MRMTRLTTLLTCMTLWFAAWSYTLEEIPNVQLTDSTRFTSDPDGILSKTTVATIDSLAADIRRRTTGELAVVIVNNIDGAEPEEFATRLFNTWKIGKSESNNGILVLTVMDENYCIIRTGYGAEAVLPDITTGRIRRDIMNPYFREEQPDSALINGVKAINSIVTSPEAANELIDTFVRNREENSKGEMLRELLHILIVMAFIGVMACVVLTILFKSNQKKNKQNLTQNYKYVTDLMTGSLVASFMGLGLPLIAYIFLRRKRSQMRDTAPGCSRCGTSMKRLDKRQGAMFLTPQQATEQRLGSADYDVWRCPSDGSTTVREFPGRTTAYSRCPRCGVRARHKVGDTIVHRSTHYRNGQGQRRFHCEYCGNDDYITYTIPRQSSGVIVGGGSHGGGFGGGGFGGGGFGGGLSGGGGSGGHW